MKLNVSDFDVVREVAACIYMLHSSDGHALTYKVPNKLRENLALGGHLQHLGP